MSEPFDPTGGPADRPAPGAAWAPPTAPSISGAPSMTGTPSSSGTPSLSGTPMIPVQTSPEPRRSRGKTIGAVVGVTALVAAGAFAVVSITGNDSSGGAASPTEVGTQLTAALDNEDILGVVDLLLPGERETFRDPLIRTVDNLIRLEVLADGASLNGVSGIDLQFADVTVREEPTNVDDIVNIFLSGSASATVVGNQVPIGDLLIDEVFGGERPDMPTDPESDEFEDVQLTVVERDGRWYLSAFYAAAEQARGDDQQIPEAGIDAAGADEPQLAVAQMLEAISDQDVEDLIAVLDPTEAEALQRYAPLFLDDAQRAIDDMGVDWSIDDVEYTVEGSGDRRSVAVDAFRFTVNEPGGEGEVVIDFAGDCVTVTVEGDETETCTDDSDVSGLIEYLGLDGSGAITDLVETLQDAFSDYDPSGLAVHEVDGQWYVSPLATSFDTWNDALDALDADELTAVIEAIEALDQMEYMDELPAIVEGDTALDDVLDTESDAGTGSTFEDDAGTGSSTEGGIGEAPQEAVDLCYDMLGTAEGVQCLLDGIAAGTIDPELVNAAFRFPECGVADAYWADVYSMPDADFVALVERGSPCFRGLIAAGNVDPSSVPSEFLDPSCLEGRNWYTTFEDDYNDRFYDCTDAALESL